LQNMDTKSNEISDDMMIMAFLRDETNEESGYIPCAIKHDMLYNWMTTMSELAEKYKALTQKHTRSLERFVEESEGNFTMDQFQTYTENTGLDREIQTLLMETAINLRHTLGDEDFFDLYAIKDEENIKSFNQKEWRAIDSNGENVPAGNNVL